MRRRLRGGMGMGMGIWGEVEVEVGVELVLQLMGEFFWFFLSFLSFWFLGFGLMGEGQGVKGKIGKDGRMRRGYILECRSHCMNWRIEDIQPNRINRTGLTALVQRLHTPSSSIRSPEEKEEKGPNPQTLLRHGRRRRRRITNNLHRALARRHSLLLIAQEEENKRQFQRAIYPQNPHQIRSIERSANAGIIAERVFGHSRSG